MKINANKIYDIQSIMWRYRLLGFNEVEIFLGCMGTNWEQCAIFASEL